MSELPQVGHLDIFTLSHISTSRVEQSLDWRCQYKPHEWYPYSLACSINVCYMAPLLRLQDKQQQQQQMEARRPPEQSAPGSSAGGISSDTSASERAKATESLSKLVGPTDQISNETSGISNTVTLPEHAPPRAAAAILGKAKGAVSTEDEAMHPALLDALNNARGKQDANGSRLCFDLGWCCAGGNF